MYMLQQYAKITIGNSKDKKTGWGFMSLPQILHFEIDYHLTCINYTYI